MPELGPHGSTVPMWSGDPSPHHTVLAWFLFSPFFGLAMTSVNICHPLSQVEFSLLSVINSLNFEQGCVHTLITQASLVASKYGLSVEPAHVWVRQRGICSELKFDQ